MADFLVRFRFLPQNPVTTFCQMISAPPLDILKRPADALGAKMKRRVANITQQSNMQLAANTQSSAGSSQNYRNSRYWICLHQLKLYLYQYYGDASPRFASDVKDASVMVMKDKGRATSLVTLIHSDQRAWVLEFGSKQEAQKFEVALTESKKAVFEGKSIYAKRDELLESYQFGFNVVWY
jgi:hypothetical protein